MIFVGIDAGKHGAIAWMDGERKRIELHDLPLHSDGSMDYGRMNALVGSAALDSHGDAILATVENTISIPHAARGERFIPASDRILHMTLGAWLALLGAHHVPTTLVYPKTWKRTMLAGIANDERIEAKILKQRFQDHPIASQLHGPRGGLLDGRVDALWLAEYGRVTWRFGGKRAP
jgi:hypothetical protein